MYKYKFNALCNSAALGKLSRLLKLRLLIDQALLTVPWVKRTSTGVRYRLERADAVFLAEAVFWNNYLSAIEKYQMPFATFADLGANRGYFALYLMHLARLQGKPQPEGICVDGNQEMMQVMLYNFRLNKITITPDFGVVGVDANEGNNLASFYINQADMSSSIFTEGKKVIVPVLSVRDIWSGKMGNKKCELLKVDIEGSESKFLDDEADFVRGVQAAIIEFHEPMSKRKDMENKMANLGFECIGYEPGLVWPDLRGDLYFKKK